jgi:hypothetical protein
LGGYATWPLVRLWIDGEGVTMGPSTAWLAIFVATFDFGWAQVSAVTTARAGLRFELRKRVRPQRRVWAMGMVDPRAESADLLVPIPGLGAFNL